MENNSPTVLYEPTIQLIHDIDGPLQEVMDFIAKEGISVSVPVNKRYNQYQNSVKNILNLKEPFEPETLYNAANGVKANARSLVQLLENSPEDFSRFRELFEIILKGANNIDSFLKTINVPLKATKKSPDKKTKTDAKEQTEQKTQDEPAGAYVLTVDPGDLLLEAILKDPAGTYNLDIGDALIPKGSKVYLLLKDEKNPGLIGSGVTVSDGYENTNQSTQKGDVDTARYADIVWEYISGTTVIGLSRLKLVTGSFAFWKDVNNGTPLDKRWVQDIKSRWKKAVNDNRLSGKTTADTTTGTDSGLDISQGETRDDELTATETEPPEDHLFAYNADGPSADDRLRIKGDVNRLCLVIIARDWSPPLSIGLFGDWGTGKSSFMLMMRNEIDRLVDCSSKVEEDDTVYVQSIVQIPINAWNCMDTNLWANLAVQIMEGISLQLFKSLPGDRARPQEKILKELLTSLKVTEHQIHEIEEHKQLLKQKIRDEKTKYEEESKKCESIDTALNSLKSLKKKDWEALFTDHPELESAYTEIAGELKLDSIRDVTDQIREYINTFQGLPGRIKQLWRWTRKKPLLVILYILITVACIFAIWGPSFLPESLPEWLKSISARIIAFLAPVSALLYKIQPYWKRAVDFLGKAEKIKAFTETITLDQKTKLQNELFRQEQRLEKAQKNLDKRKQHLEQLKTKINDIHSGRHLETFLHSRIANSDYTDQLGVIAMIRKDFETLSDLLKSGVRIEKNKPDSPGIKKSVDRIVIYIDDLDRCSPKRVVEVLEAVHLLLAIDLFVVVVAVDPRWLLNSLKWHYKELFTSGVDKQGVSAQEETAWESTPYNYMDKIFQIPFTLKKMGEGGYADLVNYLLADPPAPDGSGHPPKGNGEGDGEPPVDPPIPPDQDSTNDPDSGLKPDDPSGDIPDEGEQPDDDPDNSDNQDKPEAPNQETEPPPNLKPQGMIILDIEKKMLASLQPLLKTPRSVKRLINTYRLIRAPLYGNALKRFADQDTLSGEFVAVQILLGILIGFPELAPAVFQAVDEYDGSDFWQFIEGFKPKMKNHDNTGAVKRNVIKNDLTEKEIITWERFYHALMTLKSNLARKNTDADLKTAFQSASSFSVYRKKHKDIARYSFRAGHVVGKLAG